MTSKEALKYLLVNSEELYSQYEEDEKFYLDAVELYNIVLKDLEMLEIIKKWSFIDEGYKTGYGPYTKFQCIIHTVGMKEDFEKIKEWLENENK